MTLQILWVNKGTEGGLSKDAVLDTFLSSNNLESIRDAVEQASDRLYVTWASVEAIDKEKDVIPIADLINQQDTLLRRNGPITDHHTNRHVGQTLAYKVLEHPETDTLGVLHLNLIFDDNPLDDKVWEETVAGLRTGSSVGGFTTEPDEIRLDPDKGLFRLKHGFHHYETASVENPMNPWALNEAVSLVAKSATGLQSKDKLANEIFTRLEKQSGQPLSKEDFTSMYQESYDAVYNPVVKTTVKSKKGVSTMEDDVKNQFSELSKSVDERLNSFGESISNVSNQIGELANVVKGLAVQKQDEDEKPPKDEDMEDKKKSEVTKEQASVEGEANAPAPESPEPEDSNDMDVMKAELAKANAKIDKLMSVNKSVTPRPATTPAKQGVTVEDLRKTAVEIASGQKKMTWQQVNKMARDNIAEAQKRYLELARTPVA